MSSPPRHRAVPFEHLVHRHGPTVLRVARAVVGEHDADDVWSETFLAALRAYPDLPPDANHEAWLVTIAHRKAVDAVRRRRPTAELRDDATATHDVDTELDVIAAVRALPPRQRDAVAYHHLAGLPWTEVAALLDSTPAACRRAGADGIAALRRSGHLTHGETR